MRGLKILSFGTTTLMVPTPLKVDTPGSLATQTPPVTPRFPNNVNNTYNQSIQH